MKPQLYAATLLAAACAASPFNVRGGSAPPKTTIGHDRSKDVADVDKLVWNVSLEDFAIHRLHLDPPFLDWSSDACTSSPDNPFDFPFTPACWRHDFACRNYRREKRFTSENKDKIDDHFRTDLFFICDHHGARWACVSLARIYYWFAHKFGPAAEKYQKRFVDDGSMSVPLDGDFLKTYDSLVAAYEDEVHKAQAAGLLPHLEQSVRVGLQPFRQKLVTLAMAE
ncbi:hypothetical protein E4U53_000978 [Claviceps sorghi]|nr:hypothetical protein E4U53_000978 [Claviceps sorghi]